MGWPVTCTTQRHLKGTWHCIVEGPWPSGSREKDSPAAPEHVRAACVVRSPSSARRAPLCERSAATEARLLAERDALEAAKAPRPPSMRPPACRASWEGLLQGLTAHSSVVDAPEILGWGGER